MSTVADRVLAAALVIGAIVSCSDNEPSANGRAAGALLESQWRANGQLRPGDAFSAEERECIARNANDVDLDALKETEFVEAAPEVREFISRSADECLTDAHLRHFFVADMQIQGFPSAQATCMAPELVDLVREHGFADVFDERTLEIAARLSELGDECRVG